MRSLDELRSTLARHADGLDDIERYVRPVAVRARIRAVRRRRAAVGAAAAVLVLVAGVLAVAGAGMLRGPGEIQPADRAVAGVDVPARIDVLSFPYDLTDVTDLTHDQVFVDPADHGQAVLLAASGLGDGSATLYSQGDAVARVRGDQQVSAPVDLGDAGIDLQVRFDGADADARAGVAVYEATGELAPGVDNGDAVFRKEVAGAPLVAAGFTSPGDTSVDLDVHGDGGPLRFVFYCTAQDDPLWVNVSVDGGSLMASGCEDTGADAGAGGNWGITRFPAGDHRVRAYLTDGTHGPEVAPPDGAVFGVGVYKPPAAWPRVMGARAVDSHVEYAGRDWVLDEVVGAPTMLDTTDSDVLLGFVGTGHRVGAQWSGRLTHGETLRMDSPDEANTTLGSVLLAGDRYDVTITGGKGTLLVYRPV